MALITANMKAGDVVQAWPETRKVFARYGLNLHCGGVHELEYVAQKHHFDLEKFLNELNAEIGVSSPPDAT